MHDEESRYEAVCSRDARFDGEFFFAVATTGIYCRPSCPATTPRRRNVRFFATAAAAQDSGFRACRRCRPDAVPGSAAWNIRADVVGRAMRLIDDGVVDREGVAGLAERLGYSTRQVQRQLTAELGAGPVALARARRSHTARILLQTTGLPVTDVVFAAGFASVRQFNDTIRDLYGCTPRELRAVPRRRSRPGTTPDAPLDTTPGSVPDVAPDLRLRLAFRGPYAAAELFDHLGLRAITGVEEVVGERGDRTYRRTLRLPYGIGIAEVAERAGDGWLDCRLHLTELRDLTSATQRVRRLFDLDADPYAVADRLGADPMLAGSVAGRPGLRAPGTTDPEELAVRAVLGQNMPLADGRRLGAQLVAACGEPLPAAAGGLTHLFPAAHALAGNALTAVETTESGRAALRALCTALADGVVVLDPGSDRDAAERALLALEGIEPWTAGHIRQRALADPDVFPAGDPELERAMAATNAVTAGNERWRPWRSYAMHHLLRTARTAAGVPATNESAANESVTNGTTADASTMNESTLTPRGAR